MRVSVTKYILTIFRSTTKTLVAREGTGLRYCCAKAVPEISKLLAKTLEANKAHGFPSMHYKDQPSHQPKAEDGILTRLWPFQEIILSDNLQFVRCEGSAENDSQSNPFTPATITTPIIKTMLNLGYNWTHYHTDVFHGLKDTNMMPFVRAFIENVTVSRGKRWYSDQDSISKVVSYHHTPRYTTNSRDFILAIMPQCYWYSVPSDAKDMTFGGLFLDMCLQVKKANDPLFCPHVSSGTTRKFDIIFEPTPTESVPMPQTLTEFMNLLVGLHLGVRLPPRPKQLPVYPIEVRNALGALDIVKAFDVIIFTMQESTPLWESSLVANSHQIGLLSVNSRNPSEWDINWHRDYFKILSLIFQLSNCTKISPASAMVLEIIKHHLCKTLTQIEVDELLRLTVLVSCGFGTDSSGWSKDHLTLILITFHGQKILGLVYTLLINQYAHGKCEFFVVEIDGAMILGAKSAEPSTTYTKCFYPCHLEIWVVRRTDQGKFDTLQYFIPSISV